MSHRRPPLVVLLVAIASALAGVCILQSIEARVAAADPASPGVAAAPAPAKPGTAEYFTGHVAPLLARHCLECHDTATRKGKLDLSRKDAAMAGGKRGKAIVPGKSAESRLWESVESGDMPEDRPPLSPQEKKVLKDWIDAGAVWPGDAIDPLALIRDGRAAQNWLRRLTVPEYVETVRAAVGVDVEEDARKILPPDGRADGFTNTAYNLNVDLAHVEAYARLAAIVVGRMDVEAFAAQFSQRKELGDGAMRDLIAGMGKWLLRGPLEEHEVAAFLRIPRAVAADGGDYREAVGCLVEAMLQSPRFVYHIETQRGDGTARPAAPHELASRMSYILWGAPPDKELVRAADAGELSDRARVASQVRRMLEDPRAVKRSARFISDWLNLDRLATLRPSRERFPNWDAQLAADMRAETLAFFEEIAWKQKRPLSDLMNAEVTFATPRLAAHYGLSRAATPDKQPAPVARGPRRVTGGLKVLYTFEEGKGETVRDVSGVGEAAHLSIADASAVRWDGRGLTVHKPTVIAGAAPKKLIGAVKQSGAITVEAWFTPADASQAGPARIVTISRDTGSRNVTLGQDREKYEVRLRTKSTDANGLPALASPGGVVPGRPAHLVYTRDAAGRAKLYLDGTEKAAGDVGGDLSNWDDGFRLALANEHTNDRPWLGTLHLVAVYDRALSAEDVSRNRAAGARPGGAAPGTEPSRRDLLALYRFDEGTGDTVRDSSGAGEPLNLKIEHASAVKWGGGGLTVNEPTLIATAKPATRLVDALKKSNAITIEAWIAPRDAKQAGPARVVTLSADPSRRNFTLGQAADRYEVRLRSEATDGNGMPALVGQAGVAKAALTHVVYTRTASGQARLYVDGEEKSVADVGGDFSNWDGGFRLALANELTKDRPWRGTFRRVAIYGRALSLEEVRAQGTPPAAATRDEGIARYDLSSVPARGGLLTQGSVLTIGGDEASMVARGLFVLKDLLSSAVGSAPPGVDTTPVPAKPGLSRRTIAEGRLAISSCAGCHSKFEPLAFGLERFDGTGAYHEKDEHGNTLREDGQILFPGADKPVRYQSSAELMNLLAGSDRVKMNITRKVTQFALGRPLVEGDGPELERIHKAAQDGGRTYAGLITAVVMSDLVQTTRTETSE